MFAQQSMGVGAGGIVFIDILDGLRSRRRGWREKEETENIQRYSA